MAIKGEIWKVFLKLFFFLIYLTKTATWIWQRNQGLKKGEISHHKITAIQSLSVSLANLQLRFPPHLTNLLFPLQNLQSNLSQFVCFSRSISFSRGVWIFKTLVLGFWLDHRFLLIWIVRLWLRFWIGSYVLSVIISERCKLNRHGACADRFLGALHRRFLLLFFKFLVSIWKFEYLELISFEVNIEYNRLLGFDWGYAEFALNLGFRIFVVGQHEWPRREDLPTMCWRDGSHWSAIEALQMWLSGLAIYLHILFIYMLSVFSSNNQHNLLALSSKFLPQFIREAWKVE